MMTDINVEELLKNLTSLEGIDGYVIFNNDGVPLKYDKKTSHEKAVHMSALFQDLWLVTGKVLKYDLKYSGDNEVEIMRLRTKHSFEFIVTQAGDYTIIVKQLCGKAIEEARLAELELAKQQAEAEEEKKKK